MRTKIQLLALLMMAAFGLRAQTPCNATFTYTVSPAPSGSVVFTANSPGTPTQTYTWSFGNGTMGSGNQTSTVYNSMGPWTVCLVVIDSSTLTPCMDSSCQVITLSGLSPCAASFTFALDTATGASPNTYHFHSTSVGTGLTYSWSWGDGTPNSSTVDPYHTFPAGVATYTVCLHIANAATGCSDSTCHNVTTTGAPCAASFTVTPDTSSGAAPNTYIFTNTSTYSGAMNYVLWYFSDGSPYDTNYNCVHTFPTNAPYTVCLSFVTASGCSDSTCAVVTNPTGSGCNASFFMYPDTSSGAQPHTYIGINNSTGAGLTYTWLWGDGTSSTGAYPTHVYANAGWYTICLVVSSVGCVDSFCNTQYLSKTAGTVVTVNVQAPSAVQNVTVQENMLYPNPAEETLFIRGDAGTVYTLEVYSLSGSLVMKHNVKGGKSMDISKLPASMYTVKISSDAGETHYAKFQKQ